VSQKIEELKIYIPNITIHTTLTEEHRLRLFHNRVLRRISGNKRVEMEGGCRRPNIIRVIKLRRLSLAGHVARMGELRNADSILVGKLEGKRPVGRHRRRWEDNIRMDLREIGWEGVNWIHLAQDRDAPS
jgi:hypothetical protein